MSTVPHELPASPSIFRIFNPTSPAEEKREKAQRRRRAAQRLTLRVAFDKFLKPDLPPEKKSTISEYRTALNHWERLTNDPPLAKITNDGLRSYRDRLLQHVGAETVRKNWRHLRAILRRCGPQADRNPLGRGLLKRIPYMQQPSEVEKDARIVTFAELTALYQACAVANWPQCDVPAPAIWRCALVLAYNYGLRTQDLFQLPWSAFDPGFKSFTFRAQKTRRKQRLPLNRVARAHVQSIRGEGLRPLLFCGTKSHRQLYRTWTAINEAAGIEVPVEFRDLRESCNSRLEKIRPGVGKFVLGHKLAGVNEKYYLNATPQIREAINRMPQPRVFREIFGPLPPPKPTTRRLFEADDSAD
jgi:integrase